jgi:hypothetical protein
MDIVGGSNNCINYINKLTNMAGGNQTLFIGASSGYSNINWYFDDTNNATYGYTYGLSCVAGVTSVDPTPSIFTTAGPNYVTNATDVAGYFTCGFDCTGTNFSTNAIDGAIKFYGNSGWYIMSTVDSYNGQLPPVPGNSGQWSFETWFSSNSFGSSNNYANTPVGAVVHVDEPYPANVENRYIYFGNWAAGQSFAISAWDAFLGNSADYFECAAVGDPFTTK